MQKKIRIALAAGAATLLAIGGVAGIAHAKRGWHHGGHHGVMMQMAERYDANKDGKISQEEIDQNRTERHAQFDGDKNATLSLEEFKGLWMMANQERMVREFQEFDRDGNAQVTLEEYKAPLAQIVANRDHNNDGFLSRDDRRHGKHHQRMKDKAPAATEGNATNGG